MFQAARRRRKARVFAALAILSLGAAATGRATAITYFVTVDSSSISGNDGQLDFQFNPGSGTQAATAGILNFGFSEGGPNGSPTLTGGASGDLSTMVQINNSAALNDYLQAWIFPDFFQFYLTLNGPALSSPDGSSTDTFGLALYDPSFNPQLNDGSQGDFIFTVDVGTDGNTTFNLASSPPGLVTFEVVPEPSTWLLCGAGLAFVVWRKRRGSGNASC
jgi:hypothetical protein